MPLIYRMAPVYPRRSRMLEEEGTVKLKVHVSAEGNALGVQLFKSSGFPVWMMRHSMP